MKTISEVAYLCLMSITLLEISIPSPNIETSDNHYLQKVWITATHNYTKTLPDWSRVIRERHLGISDSLEANNYGPVTKSGTQRWKISEFLKCKNNIYCRSTSEATHPSNVFYTYNNSDLMWSTILIVQINCQRRITKTQTTGVSEQRCFMCSLGFKWDLTFSI